MAKIVLPFNLQDNDFVNPVELDSIFQTFANEINGNLDSENISPSADLDPRSLSNGGGVTQGEVTATGEAGKIPKFDSDGNLVVTRVIFKDQA